MKNGRANPQSSGGIVRSDIVGDGSQVLRSTRRKSKLHRSKRRNAASTSSSVANWPRLAFQDCGKMGGINFFRLSIIAALIRSQAANLPEEVFETGARVKHQFIALLRAIIPRIAASLQETRTAG